MVLPQTNSRFVDLTLFLLFEIKVLGRNCRFLQGPETDPKATEKIRKAIEEGNDMSVCLLNYRVDGTTFWNQFFIAALRDAAGNITNYVGVQCKVRSRSGHVSCSCRIFFSLTHLSFTLHSCAFFYFVQVSDQYAANVCKSQEEEEEDGDEHDDGNDDYDSGDAADAAGSSS